MNLYASFARRHFTAVCFLAVAAYSSDLPALEVKDVTARQRWPWNNLVDIDFVVATNGTESAGEFGLVITGSYAGGMKQTTASTFVTEPYAAAGTNRVTWNLGADYPGLRTTDLAITVTATDQTESAPVYLVIDLARGPTADSFPTFYTTQSPDLSNDTCRTGELWLRRIPAGSFTMGSPGDETGRLSTENQVPVTLTKSFYLGIFEVTQRQWYNIMGTTPSYYTNSLYRDTRPVEQISYSAIRGANDGTNWPASSAVDAASFMGVLRSKTGIETLDLPTEAQWERACRAGTSTALYTGYNLTNSVSDMHVAELARYKYSGDVANSTYMDQNCTTANGSAAAGSCLPNTWGLYDLYGNMLEWCLDWYASSAAGGIDPKGPSGSTGLRIRRGGSYDSEAWACRSAFRWRAAPDSFAPTYGFRLANHLP